MANPPPPYDNITGISRAAMKDNAQVTLAEYDGNARPGELVVDQTTSIVYVGNALGDLTAVATPGGATTWALLSNKDGAAGPTIIALGQNAGLDGQANAAIALGEAAGAGGQNSAAIAIGQNAGANTTQGSGAVAIGVSTGFDAQGQYGVPTLNIGLHSTAPTLVIMWCWEQAPAIVVLLSIKLEFTIFSSAHRLTRLLVVVPLLRHTYGSRKMAQPFQLAQDL